MFWFSTLTYIFPKKFADPITDGFYGLFDKTKAFFKFGKKETDLKSENLTDKNLENKPIINSNANLDVENRNQNDNKAFNNAYPSLDDNKKTPDEENLDQ